MIASSEECTTDASIAWASSARFSTVTSSQTPSIRIGLPSGSTITSPWVRIRNSEPSGRVARLTSSKG